MVEVLNLAPFACVPHIHRIFTAYSPHIHRIFIPHIHPANSVRIRVFTWCRVLSDSKAKDKKHMLSGAALDGLSVPLVNKPKIIEEQSIHKGWINLVRRIIRHPNGDTHTYEIVNPDSHSVSVVAFDEDENILLVELYRFGQNKRAHDLPGGAIEDGESFVAAAQRELLEETGYKGEMQEIGSHHIAAEHGVTRHVFLARSCKKVAELNPDDSERAEGMKMVKVSLDQFLEILRSGQMTETASGFMVMDYLRRFSKNEIFR